MKLAIQLILLISTLTLSSSVFAQEAIPIEVVEVAERAPAHRPLLRQETIELHERLLLQRPNLKPQAVFMGIGGTMIAIGVASLAIGIHQARNDNSSFLAGLGPMLVGFSFMSWGALILLCAGIHYAVKRKRLRAVERSLGQTVSRVRFTGDSLQVIF